MSKEDFAAYFAALEKSSDRARSLIYIFTIVSITVLFYVINSFVYPSRQFTFELIKQIVECRYDTTTPNQICTDLGPTFIKKLTAPPQLQKDMEKDWWQHQLNLFYDDSVSTRTFQFPFFGITADRDLVWMIFPFLGILQYYLIWLALARAKSLFCFLAEQNKSDPTRLRLILSTQLLTSPLNDQSSELSKVHQTVWKILAISVFFIPIVASLITILDQTNLLAILRGSDALALANVNFQHTPGFILRFVIELGLLAFQGIVLAQLMGIGMAFGRDQSVAQRSIAHAES
jgi:hypothetical protein